MKLSEQFTELIGLMERAAVLLHEMQSDIVQIEGEINKTRPDPLKAQFGSKVDAMHQVLRDSGRVLYLDEILKILSETYNLNFERKAASGILRRYSGENKIFTAEGGNRFGLLEWSSKS